MKKKLLLEYIYYLAIFLVCIKYYTVRLTFISFNDNFIKRVYNDFFRNVFIFYALLHNR